MLGSDAVGLVRVIDKNLRVLQLKSLRLINRAFTRKGLQRAAAVQ